MFFPRLCLYNIRIFFNDVQIENSLIFNHSSMLQNFKLCLPYRNKILFLLKFWWVYQNPSCGLNIYCSKFAYVILCVLIWIFKLKVSIFRNIMKKLNLKVYNIRQNNFFWYNSSWYFYSLVTIKSFFMNYIIIDCVSKYLFFILLICLINAQ